MGWTGIGWWIALGLGALGTAVTYLWPSAREFGYVLLGIAILSFIAAGWGASRSGWPHFKALVIRLGTAKTMLLFGIFGTWIFLTLTLGVVAWTIAYPPPALGKTASIDEGPISWLQGFSSMEGGMNGLNVFALSFQGANISKEAIELKSAHITSLIDGTRLDLEIIGNDPEGKSKIVPINRVQLIAPGAPIELVAKFGPPDPNAPGKILGLDPKVFLEKWRQFSFNAADNRRAYHFDVNENAFMVFFKGKVGPRVTLKPENELNTKRSSIFD
jgi:hypothetical protein